MSDVLNILVFADDGKFPFAAVASQKTKLTLLKYLTLMKANKFFHFRKICTQDQVIEICPFRHYTDSLTGGIPTGPKCPDWTQIPNWT